MMLDHGRYSYSLHLQKLGLDGEPACTVAVQVPIATDYPVARNHQSNTIASHGLASSSRGTRITRGFRQPAIAAGLTGRYRPARIPCRSKKWRGIGQIQLNIIQSRDIS